MIATLSLSLALAVGTQGTVSAGSHPGSGSMTAPPGGTDAPDIPTYQLVHFGGFGQGTQTGYWEEAVVYAPDQSKPRPMLVLFLAAWVAKGYPLTRARHAEILHALDLRNAARERANPTD